MSYESGDITKSLFGYLDNKPSLSHIFEVKKPLKPINRKIFKPAKLELLKKVRVSNEKTDLSSTLFIGNLPITTSKRDLHKLLKSFGKIVNLRFRSIPVVSKSTATLETAIKGKENTANLKRKVSKLDVPPITSDLPVKVALKICTNNPNQSTLYTHASRTNKNAYVNFESPDAVHKAIEELNGFFYKGTHHLRLDQAMDKRNNSQCENPSQNAKVDYKSLDVNSTQQAGFDRDRTVFLGNLPIVGCEDEDLWKLFDGKLFLPVQAVRIIRQKDSITGTGCGFVIFKNADSVPLAVMHNEKVKISGRPVRIKKCFRKKKSKPISSHISKRSVTKSKGEKNKSQKLKYKMAKKQRKIK